MRDPKWKLPGLNAWIEAFEKREPYFAFKSDYYTHVKDIPPQYGPGYDGGFEDDRVAFSKSILGKVSKPNFAFETYGLIKDNLTHYQQIGPN